jgi:hypothetical protein
MESEILSELYDEYQNTSSEIMNEMSDLLNIVLNQPNSQNNLETDNNQNNNQNNNANATSTNESISRIVNANVNANVNIECKYVIYPMNYENISNISIKKRFMILNNCNVISLLFDAIWDEKCNKNFVKVLNYSQVIYFFNSNITYTNIHEIYAYEYFFNRINEVLYEFLYDLHLDGKLNDNNIILYISKIRKLEKEGYKYYINTLKDKLREKYFDYSNNKFIIEKYEKYITRKNNGNYTEEYLILKNYINEYNKKKSQIHTFMHPYIIIYEKQNNDIAKANFASLYLIPEFLK